MRSGIKRTAAVVGGGIGGLATALGLQRDGWQVSVRERAATLDRGGAGLVLWPNALRCLRALGVEDAVRARATPLAGSVIRRTDGRCLARISTDGPGAALGIIRSDLVEALAEALEPGVLQLDSEVRDLADVAADLVVGADGLHSAVRASLGSDVVPEYRGYTVWRALIRESTSAATGRPELSETWGAGLRFGVVPVGTGATYVYAAGAAPEGGTSADELAELRQRFGRWHASIPGLLEAMDDSEVLRHDIYDLPPGRTTLHRERRVLVGDAAHAMEPNLGQGAGLALEDAVTLAHTLAAQSSVEAALRAYARARAPRVVGLARQSRRIGRLAGLTNPAVVSVRDLAMLATPDRLARRASNAVAGWSPARSAGVRPAAAYDNL